MSGTTFSYQNQDFLYMTIGLTQEVLSDILSDIEMIGDLNPLNEIHWNNKICKLTLNISKFVELTTLFSKVMLKTNSKVYTNIKDSHIHLLFILKGMNQAQQKQDFMALEELIKYELKDNLTQWKIDLIPQTKKLLNT